MKACEFCGKELLKDMKENCDCPECKKCEGLPTFCSEKCALSWVQYIVLNEKKAQVMH
jgi:hypothetical protein